MQIIKNGSKFQPKHPIKLIAFDMDGTLLDSQKNFPPNFFEIMDRLQRQGIIFVAASGRSYSKQREIFQPAKISPYFLCDNGGILILNDKIQYAQYIDMDSIHSIIDITANIKDAIPIFCGYERAWHLPVDADTHSNLTSYFSTEAITENLHDLTDPILKVALYHPESSEKYVYPILKEALDGKVNLVVSGEYWMDIMKLGVNKGNTLKDLQKDLGITPEETMVFGDYYNDIEMLQCAYYSFVMENANDDMKQYGNFQAPSNDEYGVQQILECLVK